MDFRQIYVFREVNTCADRMTNFSMKNKVEFVQYSTLSNYIRLDFFRNRF